MRARAGTAAALAPALLVALFGAWCGTDWGSSGLAGAVAGEAVLLAAVLAAGTSGLDPLRLGPLGRLLPAALWILAAASAWASPVPRAGRTALALLPAFLLLPGAVARCWENERARQIGLRALSAAVGLVALYGLLAIPWRGTQRASLPLGHHNLLAAWLALLLPLALLPARERNAWRWLGWAAGLSALAAVAASRSLAGTIALAVEALLAGAFLVFRSFRPQGEDPRSSSARDDDRSVPSRRRTRLLLAGIALAALVALLGSQLPRVQGLRAGTDPSLRARLVYLEGGWRGFRARPFLGWGPGSTPWTAAAFLRPEPGINPPTEIVGELHSLPLQLLYELGATGGILALGLAAAFLRRRLAELPVAVDRPLLAAGLLGLAGGAAAALASAAWAVTALPVAAAVAGGCALAAISGVSVTPLASVASSASAESTIFAASAVPALPAASEVSETAAASAGSGAFAASLVPETSEESSGSAAFPALQAFPSRPRPHRGLALAYAVAAALALAPGERARFHYERAIAAGAPEPARRELVEAVRLDPAFPLYAARLALLADRSPRGRAAGAELSRQAALGAPGAGALWLIAGLRGAGADRPWTRGALARACALDPLAPFAPFLLATSDPPFSGAAALGARALLAEPRLGAATAWDAHEDLLARALAEVLARPGIDPGYRLALAGAVRSAGALRGRGERDWLAFTVDPPPDLSRSLSLQAFRRRPWAARWEVVRLWRDPLDGLDLPPATVLPTSSPAAFPPCLAGLSPG